MRKKAEFTKRAEGARRVAMADFDLIVAAAIANERCPVKIPFGPLRQNSVEWLTRHGMIEIEIYRHNFRRINILIGPHVGKMTASPLDVTLKPWKIVDVNGSRLVKSEEAPPLLRRPEQLPMDLDPSPYERVPRPQPSKPRALTRAELEKL